MATAQIKKINPQTRQLIADTVFDVLSDPDFGLELREDFKKTLIARSKYRGRTLTLAEVKKRYL